MSDIMTIDYPTMRLYDDSEKADGAMRCAHCGSDHTHPTDAAWLRAADNIERKDTVWSRFCCYLGCEGCPGITGVHMMFHKGSTWVHTERMRSR
jgi:hypothetical protein